MLARVLLAPALQLTIDNPCSNNLSYELPMRRVEGQALYVRGAGVPQKREVIVIMDLCVRAWIRDGICERACVRSTIDKSRYIEGRCRDGFVTY